MASTHSSIFELNDRASRPVSRLRHVRNLVPLEPVEHPSPGKLDSPAECLGLALFKFPGFDLGIESRPVVAALSGYSSSGPDVSSRRRCGCLSWCQRVLDGVGLGEAAAEKDVGAVQPEKLFWWWAVVVAKVLNNLYRVSKQKTWVRIPPIFISSFQQKPLGKNRLSGPFQHQRSTVRILTLARFYPPIVK